MTTPILRALVVEDDHSWQQILSEILSDCGLEVDVAGSLDLASLSLKAQPHRLAVVDLSLSPNDHNNYDGLRVLDAVREAHAQHHFRYQTIRRLAERRPVPAAAVLVDDDPAIRPMTQYTLEDFLR